MQEKYCDDKLYNLVDNFVYQSEQESPVYGVDTQIYYSKAITNQIPNQKIFSVHKTVQNALDFNQFYEDSANRLTFDHKNLLKFYGYNFSYNKNICGSFNKADLYYQYCEKDLDYEIAKRSLQ